MDLYSEEVMMESPGKFLKKERETRNISLDEISNFTKIKEHHLKAIEDDRYELLPHTLYVKGYLKGYAKYLSLDPNDIIFQYENYLKSLIPPEPVELPQPVPHPKKHVRPWFILSLVFAFILFVVLYISYPIHRLVEQNPTPILSLPVSSVSALHQEVGAQTIYMDKKIETPGSDKLKPMAGVKQ
jgi:cytoskeletal protein RodZ